MNKSCYSNSMDSHQLFRYNVPGADLSYEFSPVSTPVYSEWMPGPMKSDFESSPNSPLSSHFDYETFSSLSNSQEQYSSTENPSGISPSRNSSLEIDSSLQRTPVSHNATYSQSMKHALEELETVLMAPDTDEATAPSSAFNENVKEPEVPKQRSSAWSQESTHEIQSQPYNARKHQKTSHGVHQEKCQRSMDSSCSDLKQLLIECARAMSENRMSDFDILIKEARGAISISGEPIQRLGAYMVEGLVARQEATGANIYRALKCREPDSKDLLSYMHTLYEICPYFKFGYMAANGAIAEAFRNEDRVHIIDFQIAMGTQWMTLIQALAARPGGPPHVRITGVDDPVSRYARGDGLDAVEKRLAAMSEKFNIPVEFNQVPVYASEVTREMLDVRPGESLAVNFTLQLHHTPDESVDVNNPRDGLLRMVKSLSPKVTTLVEQESNTNTTPFFTRSMETLNYYSAMFESIDVTMPRDSKERINVEMHCLAKDIVNIVACEGKERVERHELLGKWKSRLGMAGFRPCPLSSYVNSVIRTLLGCYSKNYTLVEKDGAMLLGWKDRNLISASAWH